MGVDEDYLDASFAAITHAHGGIAAYLLAAGLSDGQLAAFRDRMTAKPAVQPIT